jgi:hypothetical protein
LQVVQHRKFAAAILAILIVAIVAPISIPKGHADDTSENLQTSGYVIKESSVSGGFRDIYLNSYVDAIKAGSVMTFTLIFQASPVVFQRNVSMGVKFDWMSNFQNSSMASPQNTFTIFANQIVIITLSYTIPDLTGQYADLNLETHSWTVQVWDGPANSVWTNGCGFDDVGAPYLACRSFFNSNPLAIYSSAQASGMLNRLEANNEITALSASLRSVLQAPPGSSNAVAMLAAASTQMALGDTAYSTGDFSDAQTDYQNSLNDANAAQSSLATTGGGTDTATLSSIWIQAIAILFGGIGALLVGFAGFKYLRARSKTISGSTYTPVSTPRP